MFQAYLIFPGIYPETFFLAFKKRFEKAFFFAKFIKENLFDWYLDVIITSKL